MTQTLIVLAVLALVVLVSGLGRERRARAVQQGRRRELAALPAPEPDQAWLPIVRPAAGPAVRLPSGGLRVELRAEPANAAAIKAFVGDRWVGRLPERVTTVYRTRLRETGGRLGAVGLHRDGLLTIVPVGLMAPAPPQYLHPAQAWGWSTTALSLEHSFVHAPGVLEAFRAAERALTDVPSTLDDVRAVLTVSDEGFVDVLAGSAWLGALGEPEADQLRPVLGQLARSGGVLQVSARLVARRRAGRLVCRVSVRLPQPDVILPPGPLPDAPFVLLPPLTTLQVSGEESAHDLLAPILGGRPRAFVVLTLHPARTDDGAEPSDRVEVRLDDRTVGTLSPSGSASSIGLVRACQRAGRLPVVRGVLTGNSLTVSLAVRTSRTADVTDEWLLHELGE